MAVGEHDAEEPVAHFAHRAEMRDEDIHAQMGVVRKHEAAVHHDHAVAAFPELAVETDFAESPEGGDGEAGFAHGFPLSVRRRRRRRGRWG